jgi:hypothetical protein
MQVVASAMSSSMVNMRGDRMPCKKEQQRAVSAFHENFYQRIHQRADEGVTKLLAQDQQQPRLLDTTVKYVTTDCNACQRLTSKSSLACLCKIATDNVFA